MSRRTWCCKPTSDAHEGQRRGCPVWTFESARGESFYRLTHRKDLRPQHSLCRGWTSGMRMRPPPAPGRYRFRNGPSLAIRCSPYHETIDRPVAHFFFSTSTGTFGPLASNGSWTIMMYMKTDRPVNKRRRGVHRAGRPMVLLSCPAVGRSIELPMQGTVPDILGYHNNYNGATGTRKNALRPLSCFSNAIRSHVACVCFSTDKTVLTFFVTPHKTIIATTVPGGTFVVCGWQLF